MRFVKMDVSMKVMRVLYAICVQLVKGVCFLFESTGGADGFSRKSGFSSYSYYYDDGTTGNGWGIKSLTVTASCNPPTATSASPALC